MTVLLSKSRRGLNDIRTMSDMLTETSNPQRKFLKMAMLSMEKARRGKERESARKRIEDIDTRTVEIEAETENLLQLVEAGRNTTSDTKDNQPKPAHDQNRHGHKLRY